MNAAITIEKIREILERADKRAPLENIRAVWPKVQAELEARGKTSDDCMIAAIATIGVETGSFAPIKERGGAGYFAKLYDGRADLGNCEPGDGARFRGRGLAQITGRDMYLRMGRKIGVDLIADPDKALDPANAAKIFAEVFLEKEISKFADAGNWERVRRRWNGGLNGWAEFMTIVEGLSALCGRSVCVVKA